MSEIEDINDTESDELLEQVDLSEFDVHVVKSCIDEQDMSKKPFGFAWLM